MRKLTVKGRYLAREDGEPFFYLGDTAWELFHRLSKEEIEKYMTERERQGFNAVQAVALSEFEGTTVPNFYGRYPLLFTEGKPDPTKPDTELGYSYWDHVDFAVESAARHNLFISMVITWGDKFNICWGKGPEIFTEENAYEYGKWIAERYKDNENIIWFLGGDRPLEEKHRIIVDAMAKGIKEADQNHLITYHPSGASSSIKWVGDADYIDFHTAQTGHGINEGFCTYKMMEEMAAENHKPYMDSEPRYESHPACFDLKLEYLWQAREVRQNAYWNLLAGACGHTYGNHCIWSMNKIKIPYFPFTWDEALVQEGAEQIGYAKKLRQSRDYFSLKPAQELIKNNFSGEAYMAAAKGKDYVYIYSPMGVPFELDLEIFSQAKYYKAIWFNPRTGSEKMYGVLPCTGKSYIVPPVSQEEPDWVLILDAMLKE